MRRRHTKDNITPLDQNIPASAFGQNVIIGTCLGSGRSGEAIVYVGRLSGYRCTKCKRVFGLLEMQGLPTYRTLPNH